MAERDVSDDRRLSLAYLPATPRQRRTVLLISVLLFAGFGLTVPFAAAPLIRIDAFIPTLEAAILINDLITSILLFAQYSVSPSRALLVLAGGYLFTALIVIPHALSFPNAFAPTGLLGDGLQTTTWLYNFWHIASPAAILGYASLKDADSEGDEKRRSKPSAICLCVMVVLSLACGLTLLAAAGNQVLPAIFADRTHSIPTRLAAISTFIVLVGATALLVLWARRRSLLDYWLMPVLIALISEQMLIGVFSSARFSLGFYAGRAFSFITSIIVLTLLLTETSKQYARLAISNMMLERERQNKMMNINAATSSIAHEVRQPLMGITANASAARRWLERVPPDVGRVKQSLDNIERAGFRASEILTNVRTLFQDVDHEQQPIDMNNLTLEALQGLHGELKDHGVITDVELASELPLVMGHKVQLQEVILNLIHNAIDAMASVKVDHRALKVRTKPDGDKAIAVEVKDSGQGIEPARLDSIFEAFVTTKPNGSGLGLAICSRIIERHGGQLTASSDGKNGAVFKIVLPIAPTVTDVARAG